MVAGFSWEGEAMRSLVTSLRARGQNDRAGHFDPASRPAHNETRRSRRAFAITDTEDRLIAAAAIIGESRMPKAG